MYLDIIFQYVFSTLSMVSVLVIIMASLRKMTFSKKTCLLLLLPIILMLATLAYRFDYSSNENNDLSRYIYDFERMKAEGFFYQFRWSDQFSFVYRIIAWIFCHLDNYHWFPFWTTLVEYGIYSWILADVASKRRFNGTTVLALLMLKFALLPPIMSFSGIRNSLAFSVLALAFYRFLNLKTATSINIMIALVAILIHPSCIIIVTVFLLSKVIKSRLLAIVVVLLWGTTLALILNILQSINLPITLFYASKLSFYMEKPTDFDIVKAYMIIGWLVILTVFMFYNWIRYCKKSDEGGQVYFAIVYMFFTLGSFAFLPDVFLRLCYFVGMIFPIIVGQVKIAIVNSRRSFAYYELALLIIACTAFVSTKGGWFYQITWFFS